MGLMDFIKKRSVEKQLWDKRDLISCINFNGDFNLKYKKIEEIPEIQAAIKQYSQPISTGKIKIKQNIYDGNKKIGNAEINNLFSIKLNRNPSSVLTKTQLIQWIVETMLIYGDAVILPEFEYYEKEKRDIYFGDNIEDDSSYLETEYNNVKTSEYFEEANLYLTNLYPISPNRVKFVTDGKYRPYSILIDDREFAPSELLHFKYNPDLARPYKGRSIVKSLEETVKNIQNIDKSQESILKSGVTNPFILQLQTSANPGSKNYIDTIEGIKEDFKYWNPANSSDPLIVPGMEYELLKLDTKTLKDLDIKDAKDLQSRVIDSVFGLPTMNSSQQAINRQEYERFVKTRLMPIVNSISEELTAKLIRSPYIFIRLQVDNIINIDSDMVKNLIEMQKIGNVTIDEVRDAAGIEPLNSEASRQLVKLENYKKIEENT